jgi:hypothetical protein
MLKAILGLFLQKFKKPRFSVTFVLFPIVWYFLRGIVEAFVFDILLKWLTGKSGGDSVSHPEIYYIPVIIVCGVILLWMYLDSRKEFKERYLLELLEKMHNHMIVYIDKAFERGMTNDKWDETMKLIADRLGIIKINDWENNIKKVATQLGVDKLSEEDIKNMSQDDKNGIGQKILVWVSKFVKTPKIKDREWNVEDAIAIGEVLDGQQVGLVSYRDVDKEWQSLYKQVEEMKHYYNDAEINQLVRTQMRLSQSFCNLKLFTEYLAKFTQSEFSSLILSLLRGKTNNLTININDALDDIRTKISNRIKIHLKGGNI